MHEPGQPHPMTRYQALADDIEASIRTGVLRPGDRLPSVRRTSLRVLTITARWTSPFLTLVRG